MGAKREQIIWENVWPVSQRLERLYSLKSLLSAGILLLSKMSAEERENAIEAARLYKEEPLASSTEKDVDVDSAVAYIKKLALTDAGFETDIKIMSSEDKACLEELRAALGVDKTKGSDKKKMQA